jgi:hypothetical protein
VCVVIGQPRSIVGLEHGDDFINAQAVRMTRI